jgi:hypothetical protein
MWLLSCWPPRRHRLGRAIRGTLWGQAADRKGEDSCDRVWQIEIHFGNPVFMSISQHLFFSLIEYLSQHRQRVQLTTTLGNAFKRSPRIVSTVGSRARAEVLVGSRQSYSALEATRTERRSSSFIFTPDT